jgi:hypothetical protein
MGSRSFVSIAMSVHLKFQLAVRHHKHLTSARGYPIFPLLWKYEDILRRRFARRYALFLGSNLTACVAIVGWPSWPIQSLLEKPK